jgi:hypothetical protein
MSQLYNSLQEATADLYYISESDYPVEAVHYSKGDYQQAPSLHAFLLQQAELPADSPENPIEVEAFFAPLTEPQDWYGEEEEADRQRYLQIQNLLQEHLSEIAVYRFGEVEKTIYIVGKTAEGDLCGVRTKAIET